MGNTRIMSVVCWERGQGTGDSGPKNRIRIELDDIITSVRRNVSLRFGLRRGVITTVQYVSDDCTADLLTKIAQPGENVLMCPKT